MRKKLFAVIMSVMMMVTFMPMMAFATESSREFTGWSDDYSKAYFKVVDSTLGTYTDEVDTYRVALKTLSPVENAKDYGEFNGWMYAYTNENPSWDVQTLYLDLGSAKINKIGAGSVGNGRISYSEAEKMFGEKLAYDGTVTELKMSVPSTALNKDWDKTIADDFKTVAGSVKELSLHDTGITLKVSAPDFDETKMYTEDQSFELKVTPSFTHGHAEFVGNITTIKLTIAKVQATASMAQYKISDGMKNRDTTSTTIPSEVTFNGDVYAYYNGGEHTLSQVEMAGVTSTYELYNKETGKFEAVDSVVVKDAGTYYVKATAKDSTTSVTKEVIIHVESPSRINYVFKTNDLESIYENANLPKNGFYVGSNYNAKDFIKVTYGPRVNTIEAQAAAEKAFEADKAEIMALFDEICEIKTVETTTQEGTFTAKVTFKDFEGKEKELKAIAEKYETLLSNYEKHDKSFMINGYEYGNAAAYDTAKFFVKDEVTFTKAPLNKTYKAKNGKLAKAKKFTVKAKSLSGAKVTYKLTNGGSRIVINKNTGKVTLKKGLKKRTYNVKITATAGSYIGTTESVVVRIRVK